MKKLFLTAMFIATIFSSTNAQDVSKAIGARLGMGAEFSYQHALSDANRLEFDLGLGGWDHGGFSLSGLYHWVFNIDNGLNWYVGPGAQIGSVWSKNEYAFGIGIAGQIGIEYNFDFPLQLSLDWRPSWSIIPSGHGFGYDGVAVGVRYRF